MLRKRLAKTVVGIQKKDEDIVCALPKGKDSEMECHGVATR